MNFITETYCNAAHNDLVILITVAIVFDTIFGVIRSIKECKFNSNFGIDGMLRKFTMLVGIAFLVIFDAITQVNLVSFVPDEILTFLGLETIGLTEFFGLSFLAYESVSILKNMALCGLPVKRIWITVKNFLSKYTDELPDDN